jgi:precorrin-4/cobalt-precorrin-4 C11-methyltransferase
MEIREFSQKQPSPAAEHHHHPILFVGAGPGDPELITVKGQQALAAAQRVVYAGSLVPKALLKWTPHSARKVSSAGLHLEQIVAELAEGYAAGERVVRLHTGDPSLYGAIFEQMRALEQRGIAYQVIPGVTAAFAAAAALGLEYTLPEVTQSLILTRMAGRTTVPEKENLERLAAHGASMAIYLSMGLIDEVQNVLSRAYGPQGACAVVFRASHPDQKVVRTTIGELRTAVQAAGISRQAVIIVGPALDRRLADGGSAPGAVSKLYDRTFSHDYRRGGPERGSDSQ